MKLSIFKEETQEDFQEACRNHEKVLAVVLRFKCKLLIWCSGGNFHLILELFVQLLPCSPCYYLTLFTLQESEEKAMLDAYIEEMKHHHQQLKLIYEHIRKKADEDLSHQS